MTYNGAGGETKRAIAQTLGVASISDETLNGANRQLPRVDAVFKKCGC